ncbi:ribonuclease G [Paramagnetospirillum kuznetsovii]|uniref:Ribonuclease G n=1 Tax=Paramagnetospirillum kuznetsovii TaxID=2053833 RepID=A0A364P2W2_9PROT|nr:ribonuclease E/G [Paramagnetospirillum kuznetsovii]RAU23425.1 ribonuclease G [Paramagnetospirillum kuznetsovii]
MMGIDRIVWSWGPGDSRFALLAGDRLLELRVHRPSMLLGCAFRARVARVEASLDAAFVDLGEGDRPGFLNGAKALGLSEGMSVPVRVKAEAVGAKGPKLVHAPELVGDARRPHPLEMLLAAHPGVSDVAVSDAAALAEARRLFPAARLDRGISLDDEMEAALSPVVGLPCGGRIILEQTAALTAVDVDSGAARPNDANRQAVAEIARQLRLRGIGGQIAVDFVSGPKGTAYKLAAALKKAVVDDPVPTHVFGVSPLGLVELTRERSGASLTELLCRRVNEPSAESVALAGLRRLLVEAEARPGARLALVMAPEALACLARLGEAVAETERRLGRKLVLRPQVGLDQAMIEEIRA